MGLYSFKLFAGVGFLVDRLLGHTVVGAVERDPWCQRIAAEHQRAGRLPPFPVWDDVTTFSRYHRAARAYCSWLRSIRDELVIDGGFPCQDISLAGDGAGIGGARSGLWTHQARIIGEIRPAYAFVENVAALAHRGLDVVLGDLAALGYDARWGVVSSADAGGDHLRERLWILAHRCGHRDVADAAGLRWREGRPEPDAGREAGLGCAGELADTVCGRREQGRFSVRTRQPDAAGCGAVADASRVLGKRRRGHGDVGRAEAAREGQGHQWQRHGRAAGDRGAADGGCTASDAQPGLGRAGAHALAGWLDWPAARGCRPAAPGQPQEAWEPPRTIARYPGRADRLRIIGNGWDPYAAALAWRLLGGPVTS